MQLVNIINPKTCHVSGVRCNFSFYKVMELDVGGSIINGAYPIYFHKIYILICVAAAITIQHT